MDREILDGEVCGDLVPVAEECLPAAAFRIGQAGIQHANVGNALTGERPPEIAQQHVDSVPRPRRLRARRRDARADADLLGTLRGELGEREVLLAQQGLGARQEDAGIGGGPPGGNSLHDRSDALDHVLRLAIHGTRFVARAAVRLRRLDVAA